MGITGAEEQGIPEGYIVLGGESGSQRVAARVSLLQSLRVSLVLERLGIAFTIFVRIDRSTNRLLTLFQHASTRARRPSSRP